MSVVLVLRLSEVILLLGAVFFVFQWWWAKHLCCTHCGNLGYMRFPKTKNQDTQDIVVENGSVFLKELVSVCQCKMGKKLALKLGVPSDRVLS